MNNFLRIITASIYLALASFGVAKAQTDTNNNYNDVLSDENLLIVEVEVGRYSSESAIDIYQFRDGFYIPLSALSDIIDFPIEVNAASGEADGWFIAEERTFYLNVPRNEVIVAGQRLSFPENEALYTEDDIYVLSSRLSKWFPLEFRLNFSNLILEITPLEKLPIQIRAERKLRQLKSLRGSTKDKKYEEKRTPYKAFSIPTSDVEIGYEYDNNNSRENNISYTLNSRGDLAYLETDLFLSGNTAESLQSARISMGRTSEKADLLGVLKATQYEIGDINGISSPFVASQSLGRGFKVTNRALDRPDQFDSTSFTGNAPPNWEVEIYRNNILLDFQVVGSDGRYEFNDVDILYGNNTFRIVQYGPEGQKREFTETRNINSSFLKKGELGYKFSMDERSYSIFGVDEEDKAILHDRDIRISSAVEYGINSNITVGTGFVRTPLDDRKVHNYQTGQVRLSIDKILAEALFAYDHEDGGSLYSLNASTEVYDISVNARHTQFEDFVSEVELSTSQRRVSTSELRLNGNLDKLDFLPIKVGYSINALNEKFENDIEQTTLSNRLSSTIFGIGLSHFIQHVEDDNNGNVTEQTTGEISIRGNYKEINLRANSSYEINPDETFNFVNFTAQKRINDDTNGQLDFRKNFGISQTTSVGMTLNKIFDKYQISFSANVDDEDNITASTKLSLSFGYDEENDIWHVDDRSMASSGIIVAKSFKDNNGNRSFDKEDEILESVGYFHNKRKIDPSEGKLQIINQVQPYQGVDINVDTETLEDPFLSSYSPGYTVYTRPGIFKTIEFGHVQTTEIDGTLFLDRLNGRDKSLARVTIDLFDLDSQKVALSTITEFDGFFLFDKVLPGRYEIRISEEDKARLGITDPKNVFPITIEEDSDFITGISFRVSK